MDVAPVLLWLGAVTAHAWLRLGALSQAYFSRRVWSSPALGQPSRSTHLRAPPASQAPCEHATLPRAPRSALESHCSPPLKGPSPTSHALRPQLHRAPHSPLPLPARPNPQRAAPGSPPLSGPSCPERWIRGRRPSTPRWRPAPARCWRPRCRAIPAWLTHSSSRASWRGRRPRQGIILVSVLPSTLPIKRSGGTLALGWGGRAVGPWALCSAEWGLASWRGSRPRQGMHTGSWSGR